MQKIVILLHFTKADVNNIICNQNCTEFEKKAKQKHFLLYPTVFIFVYGREIQQKDCQFSFILHVLNFSVIAVWFFSWLRFIVNRFMLNS